MSCVEFERDWLVLLDDSLQNCGEPESGWMNFGEWTRRKRWH